MKLPSRGSRRTGLHLLVASSLVALSAGVGGLAFTSAAVAAPSAGTIKIDGVELDGGNSNHPHQACGLTVEFFNFGTTPETHTATVVFTAQPPSGTSAVPATPDHDGAPTSVTFTGLSGNQLEKAVAYTLDTSGLTLSEQQGYHVKIDVTVDEVVSKSKVIWVQACATPPVLSGTVDKTVDADGDDTYNEMETAPTVGADVGFRAVVTNTSSVEVTVGALTDSYGSVVDALVACAVPPTLAAGDSFTCDFEISGYGPAVASSVVNTFTAVLSKVGSTSVTLSDQATTNGPAATTTAPDLSLTKAAPATRTTGQAGDYTLTVKNVGTAAATSPITVTDTLPAGVTVTPTLSDGFDCTVSGSTVTCTTDDDLAVGATRTIALPATFTAAGSMLNTATVSVQGDSNQTNDTSSATTIVSAPYVPPVIPQSDPPDLAVQKTGPASVAPDSAVTWTLTVTNKGPSSATGFTVTDTLPAGVNLVSVSGSGFTCTAATVACTYTGLLAPGASAAVTVLGSVPAGIPGASMTNVVVVSPTDATPADNTDTLVSVIDRPTGPADLVLAKSGPSFAVLPGEVVTWRIDVTNAGSASASGFTVTDPLGTGLTLVGIVGDGFVCATGTTVDCAYAGALAPGETATLLVSAELAETYTASSVTNTATAPLPGDPTPANNTDTAVTGVNQPIDGGDTDPGEGEVPVPSPSPSPSTSPSPLPSTPPFADDETELPRSLPFTGSAVDVLAGLGLSLGLIGLLVALGAHRRHQVE